MPIVNKTKAEFLVIPLPAWWPGALSPWPCPFTAGNLQTALDIIEPIIEGPGFWNALKTIFLSMPLSGFTGPSVFAQAIDDYCAANNLTAWEVEESQ